MRQYLSERKKPRYLYNNSITFCLPKIVVHVMGYIFYQRLVWIVRDDDLTTGDLSSITQSPSRERLMPHFSGTVFRSHYTWQCATRPELKNEAIAI